MHSLQLVAIKSEKINAQFPLVLYEANITLLLNRPGVNSEGFSKIYGYGKHNNSFYMAMDLLGPSLADLFEFCSRKFSLKTTLMIGC